MSRPQIHPRFQALLRRLNLDLAAEASRTQPLCLVHSQQPASWEKAADPLTENEGIRPEFSPTHHPYVYIDCIKIQLEKQWGNCNCILIQWWRG